MGNKMTTSTKTHEVSMHLMDMGDQATSEQRPDDASYCYARAARYELAAFKRVPQSRIRTRSILAISTLSLYSKAEKWENVAHAAGLLLETELTKAARAEITKMHLEALANLESTQESGTRETNDHSQIG